MRFLAIAACVCCYFQPGLAFAQDAAKQLAGSWKLTSWTMQVVGGEPKETFGPIRKAGRFSRRTGTSRSSSWRQIARQRPTTPSRRALLKTGLAYTGKFTIDGDKFTTKVDAMTRRLHMISSEIGSASIRAMRRAIGVSVVTRLRRRGDPDGDAQVAAGIDRRRVARRDDGGRLALLDDRRARRCASPGASA